MTAHSRGEGEGKKIYINIYSNYINIHIRTHSTTQKEINISGVIGERISEDLHKDFYWFIFVPK